MKDSSSSDATKLLTQVELHRYIPSVASRTPRTRSACERRDTNTPYMEVLDHDEKDTEANEEAIIREAQMRLADMLIKHLKQAKVHVDKIAEKELHTPSNKTVLPENLSRRLKLLTSSSPNMAKRRMSLLSAKPVASTPFSLKIHRTNLDPMAQMEAANRCYSDESESPEDSISPSQKSSHISRMSSARSTKSHGTINPEEEKKKSVQQADSSVATKQRQQHKIWRH